jgi:osmotically-inducible protein OsmY
MDQGSSAADMTLTQQIRKAVVGESTLSFSAKNVKIISRDGKVTLRGAVKSERERKTIGDMASKIARAGNVDNQLEVAI